MRYHPCMRIESFWASGFRSLREVRLDNLGAFNVFYGPNGSGKSNLLAAIDVWLKLIPIALDMRDMQPGDPFSMEAVTRPLLRGSAAFYATDAPLRVRDIGLHSSDRKITMGGKLTSERFGRIELEIFIDVGIPGKPSLDRRIVVDDLALDEGNQITRAQKENLIKLQSIAWEREFSLVPADRMPRIEAPTGQPPERPPARVEPVSWYFRRGQLKDALFAAHNAESSETVRALERFRNFMTGSPLHRPPFRVVEDPHTGTRDVREWLPPPLDQHDISLDLAGLGIAQIYWILGQAMLSGAQAVAIEEPEAHLHAPTSGRHLRLLLERLVREKHVDQLFIATHSNLFDLDAGGFFDVRLENGETLVQKKPLDAIDEHLYEPGPTLHALEELLSFAPPTKIMFRAADGTPITAVEMRSMLRNAHPLALDYLRNLHAAAIDVVGLRSRREKA